MCIAKARAARPTGWLDLSRDVLRFYDQLSSDGPQGHVHVVEPREMLHIQHPIHLRQMPAQSPRQFGFSDVLILHALIENHLHRRERR